MDEERNIKVEYAQRFTSGDMKVMSDDPEVEKIFPLAKRIVHAREFGGHVFKRTIIIVEDWTEVTDG